MTFVFTIPTSLIFMAALYIAFKGFNKMIKKIGGHEDEEPHWSEFDY